MSEFVEHDDNTADEARAIKATRETKSARQRRVKAAWEAVLATPEGRAVVWDLIAGTGILETPVVYDASGEVAPLRTMIGVGKQEYGRKVMVEIGNDYPKMLNLMQQENG